MQAVIVGEDISSEVRRNVGDAGKHWDHARYWSVETHYLYTLLWDPFVIRHTRCAPEVYARGESLKQSSHTVLFFSQAGTAADQPLVSEALRVGGWVVLQQPSIELLKQAGGPAVADSARPCLVSLRERWNLGSLATREYFYPDQQQFLRLVPENGQVLSKIGGNPDLVVTDRTAVWAGNAFHAAVSYSNMPGVLSQLMADLGGLIARIFGCFTAQPLSPDEQRRLVETFELRRDFHSLGFAYLTVLELARCLREDVPKLPEVATAAVGAADELVQGNLDEAQRQLSGAFRLLERINRTLQPKPAIFTDTLHGGELYPDIGYFEIDWPQHPADVLRTYLNWAKTRSYRFNVDFGATTVREMAMRYPDLFSDLKIAQDEQIVEFVNGSGNQPYPPLHSLESQIRQIDVGVKVWHDVFGTSPRTYASQEYGFCPQMGAVLAQQGYEQAVIRVQNMGDAPTVNDEQIDWVAPSGDRLRSLPSHPHKSENLNWITYNNLHLKLFLHQRETPNFAVFTCLGDITYHRHMREELARVCHYAPVFGRFATFAEYFNATCDLPLPEKRLAMQDFHCDAGFLNLSIWSMYADSTGDFITNCSRSMAATSQFAAAELLEGVAVAQGARPLPIADHDSHWEALSLYQGHGTYVVPNYPSGAFLGGVNNPTHRASGRGVPEIAEYIGPFSSRPVKDVTGPLMDAAERASAEIMQLRLRELAPPAWGGEGFMLYNFSPARGKIVSVPKGMKQSWYVGKRALPAQDGGETDLVLVDLPAHGYAFLNRLQMNGFHPDVNDPVLAGADYLENEQLRAEFDLSTGTLRRLYCKTLHRDLLVAGSHAFYCPGSRRQRCMNVRRVAGGPLRGMIEFDIELSADDQPPCIVRTRAWLDTQQSALDFETEVLQAPSLAGNQWENHVGVRFELAESRASVSTCHFNVLEPHDGQQLISPNVLLAQGEDAGVVFLNQGNEFYLKQDAVISSILIVQNESARRFRYAVGLAEANPLMQGRRWQQPVIIQPVSLNAPDAGQFHPHRTKKPTGSFITLDSPDVELLSCRWTDKGFRVRLANTSARAIRTHIHAFKPLAGAAMTYLDGSHGVEQPIVDGGATLLLRPWDIRQLHLQVAQSNAPPVEDRAADLVGSSVNELV